jgi:hypothetical protein
MRSPKVSWLVWVRLKKCFINQNVTLHRSAFATSRTQFCTFISLKYTYNMQQCRGSHKEHHWNFEILKTWRDSNPRSPVRRTGLARENHSFVRVHGAWVNVQASNLIAVLCFTATQRLDDHLLFFLVTYFVFEMKQRNMHLFTFIFMICWYYVST